MSKLLGAFITGNFIVCLQPSSIIHATHSIGQLSSALQLLLYSIDHVHIMTKRSVRYRQISRTESFFDLLTYLLTYSFRFLAMFRPSPASQGAYSNYRLIVYIVVVTSSAAVTSSAPADDLSPCEIFVGGLPQSTGVIDLTNDAARSGDEAVISPLYTTRIRELVKERLVFGLYMFIYYYYFYQYYIGWNCLRCRRAKFRLMLGYFHI